MAWGLFSGITKYRKTLPSDTSIKMVIIKTLLLLVDVQVYSRNTMNS